MLSPVGKPYDTLEEVIGIRKSKGSLSEYGITYRQVDLLADGTFDYENIKKAIHEKDKTDHNSEIERISDTSKLFRCTDWTIDLICEED